jgi:hypothetical protein
VQRLGPDLDSQPGQLMRRVTLFEHTEQVVEDVGDRQRLLGIGEAFNTSGDFVEDLVDNGGDQIVLTAEIAIQRAGRKKW